MRLADAVIDFLAAYTAAVNYNAFQLAGQSPNIAHSPWGIWTPSRGRIAGEAEKLIRHRPVGSNAVGCSSRANAVINFLAAYTAAVNYNAFQWAG